jgi:hypothetical protein
MQCPHSPIHRFTISPFLSFTFLRFNREPKNSTPPPATGGHHKKANANDRAELLEALTAKTADRKADIGDI